jgi:hypothetical protein
MRAMASELEDKEAIRELMSAYCFYVDNGEFEQFAGLFTEDAIFEAGPFGRLQGRRAIYDFINSQVPRPGEGPARKHCTLNHLIRIDGTEARADSYVVVLRDSAAGIIASLAGRYEDLLIKNGSEWRFRMRRIHFDISGDLGLKQ